MKLAVDHAAPEVIHNDHRNGYEPVGKSLVGGYSGGTEELVGKAIVLFLADQKVFVIHPENRAGKGNLVARGLHIQYGAVELTQLFLSGGDDAVIHREAGTGEVRVTGVGVLETVLGAGKGESAVRRIVEPEVVPDFQVSFALVLRGREDQNQVLFLRIPAKDDEVRGGGAFPRFGLHHQVFGREVSLGESHQGIDSLQ